ncbi:MAG: TRAM domain-containing protein [Nitrososphaeraceae archaeon]
MKRPRSYERYEKKSDHYGGSKSPKNPISVGEEYIVTIEETSKSGTGVAKIRGFVVLVNNSNPGERVKIRVKQVIRSHAVADVISS